MDLHRRQGKLELRFEHLTDTVWEGCSVGTSPDGKKTEGTIRLEKQGQDAFTFTHKTKEQTLSTRTDGKALGEYRITTTWKIFGSSSAIGKQKKRTVA